MSESFEARLTQALKDRDRLRGLVKEVVKAHLSTGETQAQESCCCFCGQLSHPEGCLWPRLVADAEVDY